MSGFAKKILEAAGAAPDAEAHGLREMPERGEFERAWIVDGLTPFRKFLRCPPDAGGRRPGPDFFSIFLGHGKAGAEALLAAYEGEVSGDPATEAARKRDWTAIVSVARLARSLDLISWDLNLWRPQGDATKEKVGHYLTVETAERLRVAAFQSKATISGFIEAAIVAALERLEEERGEEISPRAEPPAIEAGRRAPSRARAAS